MHRKKNLFCLARVTVTRSDCRGRGVRSLPGCWGGCDKRKRTREARTTFFFTSISPFFFFLFYLDFFLPHFFFFPLFSRSGYPARQQQRTGMLITPPKKPRERARSDRSVNLHALCLPSARPFFRSCCCSCSSTEGSSTGFGIRTLALALNGFVLSLAPSYIHISYCGGSGRIAAAAARQQR
ncbi:hypothetical protein HDK90DRAFT_276486 [Phyllosticta capitalensis]|uniref:Transmembrane protein n=1 Tax=Phyllosticta capitalensis TaxID=121624 RepID=A0ABR1YMN6_9PEZI